MTAENKRQMVTRPLAQRPSAAEVVGALQEPPLAEEPGSRRRFGRSIQRNIVSHKALGWNAQVAQQKGCPDLLECPVKVTSRARGRSLHVKC